MLTISFPSPSAWETWLSDHVEDLDGVWMEIAKKGNPNPTITYAEALDVALCYGWIDGQKKPKDELTWLQRFVPRRPKSIWSKRNQEHVGRLRKAGRMQPRGEQEVERAKQDGRWEAAYDGPATATIPDDFQQALNESPKAKAFYETLKKANTYAILFRLQQAKKPETRQRKIKEFIQMLEEERSFHLMEKKSV